VSRSYPYLSGLASPAPQVPAVPLAPDVDRVPVVAPELSAEQQRRVAALLGRGPVVSLHDHPIRLPSPLTAQTWAAHVAAGRDHLGHAGLDRSGLTGIFASALGGLPMADLLRWLAFLDADIAHSSRLELALDAAAFDLQPGRNRLAVGLSLEDLTPVGSDLTGIEVLYGVGVRQAGLTYNAANALGCGLAEADDTGLTSTGRAAVELMNAIGMLVDLGHVGDRTSIDAAAHSRRPVVISHAGARRVWNSARMKPDDVLKAVADTGGVIGVEAAPNSTRTPGRAEHDLDAVMAHVEYCAELLGVDHVALGPDTMFGDHLALYAATGASPMPPPPGEPDAVSPFVAGMENPAESHRNAAAWMVVHGWSDSDAAKILGANVVRVIKEVL
jgi:membrane dipeptidase